MTTVFKGDVLIVEDNVIIAMDAEELVNELGASTVHIASNAQEALDFLAATPVVAAILDYNLDTGTSEAVADALLASGTPFVFATGYGDLSMLPERFQALPLLKKPFTRDDIRNCFVCPGGDDTDS